MAFTITADDSICAAIHLLRLDDQPGNNEAFIDRLAHEPGLAAALAFWRHIDALALMLLPDEPPPDHCWARIEARLDRPH